MNEQKDPKILKLIPQEYWDVLKSCRFENGEYVVSLHEGEIFDIGGDVKEYRTDDLTKLLEVLKTISHVREREHDEPPAHPHKNPKPKEYD